MTDFTHVYRQRLSCHGGYVTKPNYSDLNPILKRYVAEHVPVNRKKRDLVINEVIPNVEALLTEINAQDERFAKGIVRSGSSTQGLGVKTKGDYDFSVVFKLDPSESAENPSTLLTWSNLETPMRYGFEDSEENETSSLRKNLKIADKEASLQHPGCGYTKIRLHWLHPDFGDSGFYNSEIGDSDFDDSDIDDSNLDSFQFDGDLIPHLVKSRFKSLLQDALKKLQLKDVLKLSRDSHGPALTLHTVVTTRDGKRHSVSIDLAIIIRAGLKFIPEMGWPPLPNASWPYTQGTVIGQPRSQGQYAKGTMISQPRSHGQYAQGTMIGQPWSHGQYAQGTMIGQPWPHGKYGQGTIIGQPRSHGQYAQGMIGQPWSHWQHAQGTMIGQPRSPRPHGQYAQGMMIGQPRSHGQHAQGTMIGQPRSHGTYTKRSVPGQTWPPRDKIMAIQEKGINVVAKKPFFWYVSYAELEKELVREIDKDGGCRKDVHRIMKSVYYNVCKENPVLSSYMLKNVWFLECEQYPNTESWHPENLAVRYYLCLESLREYAQQGRLPQYFNRSVNLLKDKDVRADVEKIIRFDFERAVSQKRKADDAAYLQPHPKMARALGRNPTPMSFSPYPPVERYVLNQPPQEFVPDYRYM